MCRISMNQILKFCAEHNLEFKSCNKHIKTVNKDTNETIIISRNVFRQIVQNKTKRKWLLEKHYRKNQIIM